MARQAAEPGKPSKPRDENNNVRLVCEVTVTPVIVRRPDLGRLACPQNANEADEVTAQRLAGEVLPNFRFPNGRPNGGRWLLS